MPQASSRLAKIECLIHSTNNREADTVIVRLPPNGRDDSEMWLRIGRDGVTGVPVPEADADHEDVD